MSIKEKHIRRRKIRNPLSGHWRIVAILLSCYDMAVVGISYFLALWLRFDSRFSQIGPVYLDAWKRFVPIYMAFCLFVFWRTNVYKSLWKYASYSELVHLIIANCITSLFHTLFITVLLQRMPVSYYIVGAILQFVLMVGIRFSYRFALLLKKRSMAVQRGNNHVMIIGAGAAGQMLARDLKTSEKFAEKAVCFIDDNQNKWKRYLN